MTSRLNPAIVKFEPYSANKPLFISFRFIITMIYSTKLTLILYNLFLSKNSPSYIVAFGKIARSL